MIKKMMMNATSKMDDNDNNIKDGDILFFFLIFTAIEITNGME